MLEKEEQKVTDGYFTRLSKFDKPFVYCAALLGFYGGLMIIHETVLKEIFREKYELDGDIIQKTMLCIYLPWDFKILFGIICDTMNLPFFS